MRQAVRPHNPLIVALLLSTLRSVLAEVKLGNIGTAEPIQMAYIELPLSFERNYGQSGTDVRFLGHGIGYTIFLTATEAVLALRQPPEASMQQSSSAILFPAPNLQRPTVLRMNLVGANPNPIVVGLEELPGRVNDLRGDNPQHWRTNIPTYAKVKYADVYPGVDLIYYGNKRQFECDFVVAPGVDLHLIRLVFTAMGEARGTPTLIIAATGDLVLTTTGGEVRFHAPQIYQEVGGKRQPVSGRYVLFAAEAQDADPTIPEVGFEVGAYDFDKPLVIDPVLSYSTYLGGKFNERGWGIAVDAAGSAYVTGEVVSPDFPIVHPIQRTFGGGDEDVFVTKLNPAGTALVYSTYLGGRGADIGTSIAVDPSGEVYVTGQTRSANFPTAHPLQPVLHGPSDAFVAKLDATGSTLVYSTYLGGSGEENISFDGAIAVDAVGSAYVTGKTTSADFPVAHPVQSVLRGPSDAFVAKLDATGSTLVYSTYLGGSEEDEGRGIAVDSAGNVYLTGLTGSSNFPIEQPLQPTLGGLFDAFITKLNGDGTRLVYSTYLGGTGNDIGKGITVDPAGNAYITGSTASTDFPTKHPIQPTFGGGGEDAFVTKLSATGDALVYSTYLGGKDNNGFGDSGNGIAVNTAGNVYVTGSTASTDFPTKNPLQSSFGGGDEDVFVAKLNAAGDALVYSTYVGGSGIDAGFRLAIDAFGNAYVAGWTTSVDFPTVNSLQPTKAGGFSDTFVAKISENES